MKTKCMACSGTMHPSAALSGLGVCDQCGFMTADLDIPQDELEKLYGADYFHGEEYSDYTRDKALIQRNFERRLKTLQRFTSPAGQTLFELGCAYGFFLELAQKRFAHAFGMDISADATAYARQQVHVDATAGDYLDSDIPPYDVCCLWDTIEHLKEPERFLEKIGRELSPGGLLAITTGDLGSLNARLRGRKWRQIHLPTHLHYFSVKSLRKLLEAKGFEVVRVSHPGTLYSLDTLCYLMFVIRGKKEKLYAFLKKTGLLKCHVYVNLGDLMYVIARKK